MQFTKNSKVPDCIIFFLAKAYQKAHGMFKPLLKPYGLTNLQHLVLEGLWYQEGMTATELGNLLILDKATLSGILDRMEDAGWIVRKQDPHDRRVARLYPAQKAEELRHELIQLRQDANEKLLAEFSVEEKLLLKRMLMELM